MSDSTEKDFGDFLVTQLSKPESKAPHPPTQTHAHTAIYSQKTRHTVTDSSTHGNTPVDLDAHTDTDTYRF